MMSLPLMVEVNQQNTERPCTGQLMSGWPQDRKRLIPPLLPTVINGPCCSVMYNMSSWLQVMSFCPMKHSGTQRAECVFMRETNGLSWCTYKLTIETEEFNFLPPVSGLLNATWSWKQMIDLVTTVCRGFHLNIKAMIEFPFPIK